MTKFENDGELPKDEPKRVASDDADAFGLAWLKTEDGQEWLRSASIVELVGRQAVLIRRDTAAAGEEYDIIEAAIRGG